MTIKTLSTCNGFSLFDCGWALLNHGAVPFDLCDHIPQGGECQENLYCAITQELCQVGGQIAVIFRWDWESSLRI